MYTIKLIKHLQLGAIMEQQSLFIRISIPQRFEYDLDIVYDFENDKMIYTWEGGLKHHLPLIFSVPSYFVGYLKGKFGNKLFSKFKKQLINSVTKDYKLSLFNTDKCYTNKLIATYYPTK